MSIRMRKLIGAVALIVLVTVWSLVAMAVAQFPVIKANGVIEAIYFVVAGLALGLAGDAAHPLDVESRRQTTDDGGQIRAARVNPGPIFRQMICHLSSRPLSSVHAASTRRNPFHIAVAAPETSTRT